MKRRKKIMFMKSSKTDLRLQVLLIFFVGVFSVLVFRLWTIQVYRQEEYKNRSERNYYRHITVPSKRGMILDSELKPLAMDTDFWNVWIPIETQKGKRIVTDEIKTTLSLLSQILDEPYKYEILERNYRMNPRDTYYKQNRVCVAKSINRRKYFAINARQIEFPKEAMIFTEAVPTRWYGEHPIASHVLGYTTEINERELKMKRYKGYSPGDRIGVSGIEWKYESYLRGEDGVNRIIVNKYEIQQGRPVEEKPAIPGNNVVLNIDADLQSASEDILKTSRGVIIVANPKDNSILAMASSPTFNPNYFSRDFRKYTEDTSRPLLNRAISGTYPPGSVLKVFEVFALMEELKISSKHTEYCPGFFSLGGSRPQRCWKREGHGTVSLIDAVSVSCDVFFYKTVHDLGIERLYPWMCDFGFNDKTGIDLRNELNVPFPSPNTIYPWYPGYTINTSIGQGDVCLTPIQISTALCAIANGGTIYPPRVAKKVVSPDGTVIKTFDPVPAGKIEASTKTWEAARKGMWEVVNRKWQGTGRRVKRDDIELAGKTGTAQSNREDPHAWFVCYGPFEDPSISITILIEYGGHGGEDASPLVHRLLDVYLGHDKSKDPV